MFLLNGKRLPEGTPFEFNGVQYPSNWLNLSTADEKRKVGIVEVAQDPRPDDELFWVTDNNDGTWSTVPRAVEDKAARTKAAVLSKIDAVELANPIPQQLLRDIVAAAVSSGLVPADHPAVAQVKSVDDEIKRLRGQIKDDAVGDVKSGVLF